MKQERLLECIGRGEATHALLLTGAAGSGKRELARRAAARYMLSADSPERLCAQPNYCELGQQTVTVEQVRTMLESTAAQGFNGGRRAFVLLDVHSMNPQSQNALLKTLEEPPENVLFILTGAEMGVLPTIRSRCAIFRLGAEEERVVSDRLAAQGVSRETAALLAAVSDGIYGKALEMAQEEQLDFRMRCLDLLDETLFSASPFSEIAELLQSSQSDPEDGKKKKKADPRKAAALVDVWTSVMRDVLIQGSTQLPVKNADQTVWIGKCAARFTTAQIQGIIEILGKAAATLTYSVGVQQLMDTVTIRLRQIAQL